MDNYADPEYEADYLDGEGPTFDELMPARPVQHGITPLGHDRGVFFYLSHATRQVFALPMDKHSRNALMAMASVAHHWSVKGGYRNEKTGAINWEHAIDDLMVGCRDVGIFNPERLRGRGAWIDNGRSVLHTGNQLLVDGKIQSDLILQGSAFIYEAARPLNVGNAPRLTNLQANELVKICESLRWERGVSGILLAGFLAIAPICGGLAWRPSIWISGGKGTGKSWLLNNVMIPALGGMSLQAQSVTTEAGLRQYMGSDALPVLFDEAEQETAQASVRMQGILDLVRQGSSEGSAGIIKGTQTQGAAKIYKFRSCTAFCSINVGLHHGADESRFSVLGLADAMTKSPKDREKEVVKFAELNERAIRTLTPEYASGLIARSVMLLPQIRANAETFAQAIAIEHGSRRLGDQLGALLAGAYSLHSETLITPEAALAYIRRHDWGGTADVETESDEMKLLTLITQHRVRVLAGNHGAIECPVGRLIDALAGEDEMIAVHIAKTELLGIGIKFGMHDPDKGGPYGLHISTSHPALKKILFNTPWSSGWGRALARMPGAQSSSGKPVRFSTGHMARAAWLPMTVFPRDE